MWGVHSSKHIQIDSWECYFECRSLFLSIHVAICSRSHFFLLVLGCPLLHPLRRIQQGLSWSQCRRLEVHTVPSLPYSPGCTPSSRSWATSRLSTRVAFKSVRDYGPTIHIFTSKRDRPEYHCWSQLFYQSLHLLCTQLSPFNTFILCHINYY